MTTCTEKQIVFYAISLAFYLAVVLQPLRAQNENRTELHVAFITSFGGEYDSSGVIPAVQLATELINNRSDLLTDYELVIESIENPTIARMNANSVCERSQSLQTFLRQITTGVNKIALLGCGCSRATEPVAEISGFWNITHISYASGVDSLSNRQRFHNFWRTYPQESNLASSVVAIMKEYNWTVLKIITEDDSIFKGSTEVLLAELTIEDSSIFVDRNGTTHISQRDNLMEKSDLFQPEIRVYFLNMYSKQARKVFCMAAKKSKQNTDPAFYYPGYVWITLGWYRERWWTEEFVQDSSVNCTDQELEEFLPQTIAILQANTFFRDNNIDIETDVSLSSKEFREEYQKRLDSTSYVHESTAFHAFDAVWALGFTLNSSLQELEYNGYSLESFEYNTTARVISDIIQKHFKDPFFTFVGVSGEVSFDANGTRSETDLNIFKYRKPDSGSNYSNCGVEGTELIERVLVAVVNNESEFKYVQCENNITTWPDGVPPDGAPVIVLTTILTPIFIVYTILVIAGVILAIVCAFFNFIFRKRKIVRLISPNLNYIIIIGAIFLYLSVLGYVLPSKEHRVLTSNCHIRSWLQTVGYFLCFGTIVAKMWRVYYIFNRPFAPKMKGIRDWHLLIIVVSLTSVAIVMDIFAGIFIDYKATEVEDRETPMQRTVDGVRIEYRNIVCQGQGDIIWIILVFVYIALTQLVAVFFAYRTRKVEIKAMNDAKSISVIVYLTTAIVTIMIICTIVLRDYLNADAATFGGLILLFTTVNLGLLFIPKMVILYRDPRGKRVFSHSEYNASNPITQSTIVNSEASEDLTAARMKELEQYNKELAKRLQLYEDGQNPVETNTKQRKHLEDSVTDL